MNPNNDYIPEGLEFREEYMHQAFEMYDAEKKKRKKRFLFFLSTFSLLGCISIIMFYFTYQVNTPKQLSQSNKTIQKHSEISPVKTTIKNQNSASKHSETSTARNLNSIVAPKVSNRTFAQKVTHNSINKNINNTQTIFENNKLITTNTITPSELIENTNNKQIETNVQQEVNKTKNETITATKSLSSITDDSTNIAIVSQNSIDSTVVLNNSNKEDIQSILDPQTLAKNLFIYKTHQLWANAGLNSLYNYATNQHKLNSDYSFGLGYTYNNHSKISLGGSLEFYSVSNMQGSVEIVDKIYGFRASYRHTSIATKSLQYLSIKPHFIYTILNRHQVSLSYNIDVLVASKNTLSTIEIFSDYTKDYGIINARNYNQGFNRINHAVSFGYIFNLSNRFALGCNYNYGLTDITKNTFFTNQTFDRNSRLLFYLKVNIN